MARVRSLGVVGVLLERLDADLSAITCAHRAKRVMRCHIERDTGGLYPQQTYVDARISRNGMRLSVAGPGVRRFTQRYADQQSGRPDSNRRPPRPKRGALPG